MTVATLRLPRDIYNAMLAHVKAELPNEGCGIIAGQDGVAKKLYATRNAEASPFRYRIEPADHIKAETEMQANGWEELVIFHSHVASRAYPSPTDVRMSQWPADPPMDLYPNAFYVLISLSDPGASDVRAYTIHAGEVSEVNLEVV